VDPDYFAELFLHLIPDHAFKGIVQQILTGVESRLKQAVLLNWRLGRFFIEYLKGLSHEIFGPVFRPVWMHVGLKKNRFWFLNFKEAPSL
jgi:hypothetical protein